MSDTFERALAHLLGVEGGFSAHADDPGGATRYGITEAVARRHGYRGSMRTLPVELATQIYRVDYWEPVRGDELAAVSRAVAIEVFEAGVNCGVRVASRWLQECLNALRQQGGRWAELVEDGIIGPATLGALRAFAQQRGSEGLGVLHTMLNVCQGRHYLALARRDRRFRTFIYGWFRTRVALPLADGSASLD